ncbi:MAG: secondary thiamine-phosphate synthase enzyme YjbQ [Candidatus Altiarchaeota archaeon]
MKIFTKKLSFHMNEEVDIKDITSEIENFIQEKKLRNGFAVIFSVGSTAAISTMEYEPGLVKDIQRTLERIAPSNIDYEHHKTWHDYNGKSHVRATLLGPSLVVPFIDCKLITGTWQQIVLINLDTRAREREVVIQVIGE